MSRRAIGLVALALVMSTAHGAKAMPSCPFLTDPAGDPGVMGVPIQDDASDITVVNVSTRHKTLTASISVVGRPVNNDPGISRRYEVYLATGEATYVLRATLGNGASLFELVSNAQVADSGLGASLQSWQGQKSIQGGVSAHVVAISASLDRELPLFGRRVDVFARTWLAAANDVPAAGRTSPDGIAASVDATDTRRYRVGDPGCT
ncbi:MAG: hypothetical protein M3N21_01905 [Actinomycetota bacterium]|nr:hypothetical protein [Actinomycetota bacterium]